MTLPQLAQTLVACRRCPRLVRAHRTLLSSCPTAYAAPVPGHGPSDAWLWIIGLAPGARGAARTGVPFTRDRSGLFLRQSLADVGIRAETEVFFSNAVRCLPPGNLPTPAEFARCRVFLESEKPLLASVRVVLAFGAHAWKSALAVHGCPPEPFVHAQQRTLTDRHLLASYHVSPLNVNTRRLTSVMLGTLLQKARRLRQTAPTAAADAERTAPARG